MKISIILIAFGLLYVIKPDIFRRGIWRKTDVAQQAFSSKNYIIFMRILGVVFIVTGIIIWLQANKS